MKLYQWTLKKADKKGVAECGDLLYTCDRLGCKSPYLHYPFLCNIAHI